MGSFIDVLTNRPPVNANRPNVCDTRRKTSDYKVFRLLVSKYIVFYVFTAVSDGYVTGGLVTACRVECLGKRTRVTAVVSGCISNAALQKLTQPTISISLNTSQSSHHSPHLSWKVFDHRLCLINQWSTAFCGLITAARRFPVKLLNEGDTKSYLVSVVKAQTKWINSLWLWFSLLGCCVCAWGGFSLN